MTVLTFKGGEPACRALISMSQLVRASWCVRNSSTSGDSISFR